MWVIVGGKDVLYDDECMRGIVRMIGTFFQIEIVRVLYLMTTLRSTKYLEQESSGGLRMHHSS